MLVDLEDRLYSTLHISNVGSAASNNHRLAFGCHMDERFDPVNFTGTCFEGGDIRVNVLDGVVIVRGCEEVNTNLVTFLFEDGCPTLGDRSSSIHFSD